jgi:ArsR family transcriptional regulator
MQILTDEEIGFIHYHICEGIGNPHRLRLLYLVAEQPRNVTELTEALDIAQPTVSHHLRILRERGLVMTERDGTSIYYALSDPRILDAMNTLRNVVADLLNERANALSINVERDA